MANTNEISVAIPIFFSTGISLLVFMCEDYLFSRSNISERL